MVDESPPRGERTRSEILQAAHRLFLRSGYHGTSMRQIAAEAGTALGSIYNHFANKEDIFIEVLVCYHPLFNVLPVMKDARGDDFESFIRDAARRMVGGMDNRLDFLNLAFIELVEFKGEHLPAVLQKVYPLMVEFYERFSRERSALRPIPLPVVARAFLGLFFSYVMTDMIITNRLPAELQEGAFDHFVDIFLHGILLEAPAGGEAA